MLERLIVKRFIEGEGRRMLNLGFVGLIAAFTIDKYWYGLNEKDTEFIRLILGCGILAAISVTLMTHRKDFNFNF